MQQTRRHRTGSFDCYPKGENSLPFSHVRAKNATPAVWEERSYAEKGFLSSSFDVF